MRIITVIASVVSVCLITPMLLAKEKTCRSLEKKKWYLSAYDCWEAEYKWGKIKKLDKKANRHLTKKENTFLERCYWKGYQAWREGKWNQARTYWYRYLKTMKIQNSKEHHTREEEVSFYLTLSRQWITFSKQTSEKPKPISLVDEEPEEKPKVLKKPSKKSRFVNHRSKTKRPYPIQSLIAKAKWAEDNGKLEVATQIYQKAIQMGSKEAEIRLQQLQYEMGLTAK